MDIDPDLGHETDENPPQDNPHGQAEMAGALAGFGRTLAYAVFGAGRAGVAGLSGTIAGLAEEFAGQPLELAKIRIQETRGPAPSSWQVISGIVRQDGVTALFRGLSTPLVASAATNAVLFSSFEYTADLRLAGNWEAGNVLVGGAASGLAVSFLLCPVELIRTTLILQERSGVPPDQRAKGPLEAVRRILTARGPLGLTRGMVPTILREVPGAAAYFGTYHSIKRNVLSAMEDGGSAPSPWRLVVIVGAGGVAGAVYALASHPQDVIKTRIQAQPVAGPPTYTSLASCVRAIYKEGGAANFFRGIGPNIARGFPANGAAFLAYEITMKITSDFFGVDTDTPPGAALEGGDQP